MSRYPVAVPAHLDFRTPATVPVYYRGELYTRGRVKQVGELRLFACEITDPALETSISNTPEPWSFDVVDGALHARLLHDDAQAAGGYAL